MGRDAATSIDDFVTAAGRQSKMIADNLGLMVSAEDAYERYAEANGIAVSQMDDAAKKQAFLNEMLRQGAEKTKALSDPTDDLATDIEILSAALKDAKSDLAVYLAEQVTGATDVDKMAEKIRGLGTTWKQLSLIGRAAAAGLAEPVRMEEEGFSAVIRGWTNAWEDYYREVGKVVTAYNGYVAAADSGTLATWGVDAAVKATQQDIDSLSTSSFTAVLGTTEFGKSLDVTTGITWANVEALQAQKEQMQALADFTLDATMSWTRHFSAVDEQTETFEARREQLNAKHQETLEELAKRGQARAIFLNEAAEKQKLADLVWSLEQAELQLTEYGAKTRESTLRAKQKQIEDLRAQVGTQQTLLDNYYAGRLVKAGENVNALIDEEDRRHTAAVTGLEEEIAKTQELQKQQLGTLLLQTFDTWSEIKDIPPDRMLEMRTSIAKEYGLISEKEAEMLAISIDSWNTWADDLTLSADKVIGKLAAVLDMLSNVSNLPPIGLPSMSVPGAEVFQLDRPNVINNNFSQTVNTQATTSTVAHDFETMRGLIE
jgi:hypothetical protein